MSALLLRTQQSTLATPYVIAFSVLRSRTTPAPRFYRDLEAHQSTFSSHRHVSISNIGELKFNVNTARVKIRTYKRKLIHRAEISKKEQRPRITEGTDERQRSEKALIRCNLEQY
jgi:hypothetical protein